MLIFNVLSITDDENCDALGLHPSARLSGTKNIAVITDRLRIGSFFEIDRPEGFAPGTATRVDGRYDP
jgi:hypothetical protein